jgi:hypothetical protein
MCSRAVFSVAGGQIYVAGAEAEPSTTRGVALSFITEEAIRRHLLNAVNATRNGDSISIATFYLSDRKVLDALLDAAERNVNVRLILDPNRDAFGRQKDGRAESTVANELVTQSGERIQVRWYRTHGEQFHTKLALIRHYHRFIASLGSANLNAPERRQLQPGSKRRRWRQRRIRAGRSRCRAISIACGTTTVRPEPSTPRCSGRIEMRTTGSTGAYRPDGSDGIEHLVSWCPVGRALARL